MSCSATSLRFKDDKPEFVKKIVKYPERIIDINVNVNRVHLLLHEYCDSCDALVLTYGTI